MELVNYTTDPRIKEADRNRDIFYALKFTYNKKGADGLGPYYSLCLPGGESTLVLYDSSVTPNQLAANIIHSRNVESFDFSRIDRRRPDSIPEIERHDNSKRIVLFEEMSPKEQQIFLDEIVSTNH